MNVNPSNIAHDRTASTQELPNNLFRPWRETMGFCTAEEDFRRNMRNLNHTHATTSIRNERKPQIQNQKNTERHTILRPRPSTTSAKHSPPMYPPIAENPGEMICTAMRTPNSSSHSVLPAPCSLLFSPAPCTSPPLLAPPWQTLPPGPPRQVAKALPNSPVATLPARKTSRPPVVILRTTTGSPVDGLLGGVPIVPNLSHITNVLRLPKTPAGHHPVGLTRKPRARRRSPFRRQPASGDEP